MADKLTSLTGFGEGDPKREPSATSRSAGQIHSASEKARMARVMDLYRKDGAKSSALHKKMGKSEKHEHKRVSYTNSEDKCTDCGMRLRKMK